MLYGQTHVTSVVGPVHIVMPRNGVSKVCSMAELFSCFRAFWLSSGIYSWISPQALSVLVIRKTSLL